MIEKIRPVVDRDWPCCRIVATWIWRPCPDDGKASALRPSADPNHTALAKLHSKKI